MSEDSGEPELRDRLAEAAMMHFLGEKQSLSSMAAALEDGTSWADRIARRSYDLADAMLRARAKGGEPCR